ncbi:hypothetical protein PTI98_001434 [Pleurotus ostreatus]|nr:hypothetical protein PTI98_001434 [Pleurotus ostreatus]
MYAYYLIVIKLEIITFPLACLLRRSEPGVGKSVFHYTVLASVMYEGPSKEAMPCGMRLHASTLRYLPGVFLVPRLHMKLSKSEKNSTARVGHGFGRVADLPSICWWSTSKALNIESVGCHNDQRWVSLPIPLY